MRQVGLEVSALLHTMAGGTDFNKHAVEVARAVAERAVRDLVALGMPVALAEQKTALAWDMMVEAMDLCESPVEQMMLAALSHMVVADAFPPVIHNPQSGDAWPEAAVVIVPQFIISRYRLDFLVVADGVKIAVEIDGADYHSSIEARARDGKRDAYLKALGITPMRYTGQWIWRNRTRGMADEIACILGQGKAVA